MPYTEYSEILVFLVVAFGLFLLLFGAFAPLRIRKPADEGTGQVISGGSKPPSKAWVQFHFRYYIVALLLVSFEMEMMYMFPWGVAYKQMGIIALLDMGVFLLILSAGLLMGWRYGAFSWSEQWRKEEKLKHLESKGRLPE